VKISESHWLYHNYWVEFWDANTYRPDEIVLLIKRAVLRQERELARARQEVETLERFGDLPTVAREMIPDEVRMFVWQRDRGQCVRCGSRERLEFDHIIPVADGGSSTERNVQLLCEPCNRGKGRSVS
jgi:5-methylcytosine-specific restriction endonuclease McrA